MQDKKSKVFLRFLLFIALLSLFSVPVFTADDTQGQDQTQKDNMQDTQQKPAADQSSGFRFIVLSDTNPSYGKEVLHTKFPNVLKGIPKLNPAFVIHAGDMIGGGKKYTLAEYDAMWAPFFQAIKAITSANIPYLPSPGNHDAGMEGRVIGRESYSKNWLANYPNAPFNAQGNYPFYYSFDIRNSHFIILDSSSIKLGSTQIQWLQQDLANSKGRKNMFAILHVPFMSSGMLHSGQNADKSALDMLEKAGVKYVFAGHNHVYREHTSGNLKQITDGAAADDPRGEKDNMFLVVDVLGEGNIKLYPASYRSGFTKTLDGQDIPAAPTGSAPSFDPGSMIGDNCVPGNGMSSLISGEGISYESYPYKGGVFHAITIDPNKFEVKVVSAKKATGKAEATVAEIVMNTPSAIAGVNGGFFEGSGRPTNSFVEDNKLISGVKEKFHSTFVNENGRYKLISLSELKSYSSDKIAKEINSAMTGISLVSKGNNAGSTGDKAPRTGICITKEGAIKLLASNGVQKGSSLVGGYASINEFAQEAIDKHGCIDGINLDGGGSTTVEYHINGQDVSLKGERSAANCRKYGKDFPCQRQVGDALIVVPKSGVTPKKPQAAKVVASGQQQGGTTGAFTAIDAITGLAAADIEGSTDKAMNYDVDLSGSLKTITLNTPQNLQIRSAYELTGQELATPKSALDAANKKGANAVAITNGAFFGYSNLAGKDGGKTNAGSTCLFIENGQQYFPYEYPDNSKNPDFLCKNRYEFYITKGNDAGIMPYTDFESKYSKNSYSDIKYAVQGVNILYNGEVVTQYPTDIEFTFHGGKKERNGICITNDNKIILFVNTDKIGLVDLATKLKNSLNCKHALNTDGGATSSMYVQDKNYYFKVFGDDAAQNSVCSSIKSQSDFVKKSGGIAQGHGCAFNFFLIASEIPSAVAGATTTAPTPQVECVCEQKTTNVVVGVSSPQTGQASQTNQGTDKTAASSATGSAVDTDKTGSAYDFSAIDSKYGDFGVKRDVSKLSKYDNEIQEASQKYGVPAEVIKGIIMVESNGEVFPARGSLCNSAGYCGLMQINRGKCGEKSGCDWANFEKGVPKDQIFGGTAYLNVVMKDKKVGTMGTPDYFYWIAAGYNGGPHSAATIRKFAAQRLGILPEQVKWNDVTIEDARKNQQEHFPKIPSKTEEIFYYPSKVMSVIQTLGMSSGMPMAIQETATQQCAYDYVYDYVSIGKYYINPSFTTYINYNMEDYKLLGEAAKKIIGECGDEGSDDIAGCVKDEVKRIGSLDGGELELYNGPCDYGENIFSDLAEWIDACSKSKSDNCVCEIPLEYEYQKKDTDEEITITASGPTITMAGMSQTIGSSISGTKAITTKTADETLYVKKNVNILTFVDDDSGSKCKLDKRAYKFCAQTKNVYMFYDEAQKELMLKPIQYKFALEFPK